MVGNHFKNIIAVFIRVLQRDRANTCVWKKSNIYTIYMYIACTFIHIFIDCTELAHTIIEPDKSQDLHLASWSPSNPTVYFQSACKGPRTRRARGLSLQLKASRLKTQEELMFHLESEGRKRLMSSSNSQVGGVPSYSWEGQPFCSVQACLDEVHPHYGGQHAKLNDSNVNLIQKHLHRHIQGSVWSNIWIPHGPAR